MANRLHRHLKLSHHQHSGRVLPHRHTSHGVLLVLVLAAGCMLAFATNASIKAQTSQSSSVTVSGVVEKPAPSEAPKIDQPLLVDTDILTVSGTKPADTVAEIYNNNLFSGASACRDEQYSLRITPQYGNNRIVAKVVDNLGQYGPESPVATVVYLPEQRLNPQFLITGSSKYFGTRINERLDLNLELIGGLPPFAVAVDWSDDKDTDLIVEQKRQLTLSHRYSSPGCFDVKVQAEDSRGAKAVFRTIAFISQPAGGAANSGQSSIASTISVPTLGIIWPLYLACLAVIIAFWLGEKYQLRRDRDLWKTHKL